MSINQPINFLLPEDLASQIGARARVHGRLQQALPDQSSNQH